MAAENYIESSRVLNIFQECANSASGTDLWVVAPAVIALMLTIWQGRLTRKHNILSTMPLLHYHHYEHWEDGNLIIMLNLENNGFGPAIITSHTLILGGNHINVCPSPTEDANAKIVKLLPLENSSLDLLFKVNAKMQAFCPETTGYLNIKAAGEANVIKLIISDVDAKLKGNIKFDAQKMDSILEYENIYQQKFRTTFSSESAMRIRFSNFAKMKNLLKIIRFKKKRASSPPVSG